MARQANVIGSFEGERIVWKLTRTNMEKKLSEAYMVSDDALDREKSSVICAANTGSDLKSAQEELKDIRAQIDEMIAANTDLEDKIFNLKEDLTRKELMDTEVDKMKERLHVV